MRIPWIVGGILAGAVVLAACASGAPSSHAAGTPPASAAPAPVSATADVARVAAILDDMHRFAWNPSAPPAGKTSQLRGGLYINWRGSWDGSPTTAAANTNLQTAGQSDQEAGANPRHDQLTDLVYLRNLLAYESVVPGDHRFEGDVKRVEPIVRAEFRSYGPYRCWIYFSLVDLDRYQPSTGWQDYARSYAGMIATRYYDSARGAIVDPSHGTYRSDFAAECGAALLDAGKRFGTAAWHDDGAKVVTHLVHAAADPATHLFPGELEPAAGSGMDRVVTRQLKVGAQAQLLDSLLTAYDMTGDAALLNAVRQAVLSLFDPRLGVHDAANGGFYFAIDAGGQNLNSSYKETRQGWMVTLLDHLDRDDGGRWRGQAGEARTVVRERLWQPQDHGYLYRVTPDFKVFVNHDRPGGVAEEFVTSEAMGIAAAALLDGSG